jgi:hypothetical protein
MWRGFFKEYYTCKEGSVTICVFTYVVIYNFLVFVSFFESTNNNYCSDFLDKREKKKVIELKSDKD